MARLGEEPVGDAIVRCRAEALEGCFGVQIQLGIRCQAMTLRGQGAFLYNEIGGVAHAGAASLGNSPVEVVLRRRSRRASVWVNGRPVGEADVDPSPALLAVGCVGGKARFTQIAMRKL